MPPAAARSDAPLQARPHASLGPRLPCNSPAIYCLYRLSASKAAGLVELEARADLPGQIGLSLGFRQRLCLARGLDRPVELRVLGIGGGEDVQQKRAPGCHLARAIGQPHRLRAVAKRIFLTCKLDMDRLFQPRRS